jgi:hypothetical protein
MTKCEPETTSTLVTIDATALATVAGGAKKKPSVKRTGGDDADYLPGGSKHVPGKV